MRISDWSSYVCSSDLGVAGDDAGGGLSGAGHADGGGHHDAAGHRSTILGWFGGPPDGVGRSPGRGIVVCRPAVFVLRQCPGLTRYHSFGGMHLFPVDFLRPPGGATASCARSPRPASTSIPYFGASLMFKANAVHGLDRKSTRLNYSNYCASSMPSSD